MLILAPERYTAEFCMAAKVIILCIWNHCIADSIDLYNARAVQISLLQMSLKLQFLARNVFDKYLYIA